MQQHQTCYPISLMRKVLQVSSSGYYAWLKRPESARGTENRHLLEKIEKIHRQSRATYGYPRVHEELKAQDQPYNRKRIARLMRQAGIVTCMQRLWEKSLRGRTFEHTEDNKLARQFWAEAPNQRWVSDITLIPTAEGFLYVAVVMDLYSRKIIGWSMEPRTSKNLTINALTMALWKRGKVNGLLLHSDQGMEYRTAMYHQLLENQGITSSMSRKGNCHDNAAMESFFHTMKTECTHHHRFKTRDEARQCVFDYIEVFYNRQRRHSYLNYMTPDEFEKQNEQKCA